MHAADLRCPVASMRRPLLADIPTGRLGIGAGWVVRCVVSMPLLSSLWGARTCQCEQSLWHSPTLAAVEAALQAVPGVQSAAVSLAVQQAEVRYNAGTVAGAGSSSLSIEQQLVAAVEDCGFEASGKWFSKFSGPCTNLHKPPACSLLAHGPGSPQWQLRLPLLRWPPALEKLPAPGCDPFTDESTSMHRPCSHRAGRVMSAAAAGWRHDVQQLRQRRLHGAARRAGSAGGISEPAGWHSRGASLVGTPDSHRACAPSGSMLGSAHGNVQPRQQAPSTLSASWCSGGNVCQQLSSHLGVVLWQRQLPSLSHDSMCCQSSLAWMAFSLWVKQWSTPCIWRQRSILGI